MATIEKTKARIKAGDSALQKRVALVASEKGGVGKSVFARTLVDWLRFSGYRVAAYDADGGIGATLRVLGERGDNGAGSRLRRALHWPALRRFPSARAPRPPRNWSPNSPPRSCAPILGSQASCDMSGTSIFGSTCCATTTGQSSGPRARRRKPPTPCDRSQKLRPRRSGAPFFPTLHPPAARSTRMKWTADFERPL